MWDPEFVDCSDLSVFVLPLSFNPSASSFTTDLSPLSLPMPRTLLRSTFAVLMATALLWFSTAARATAGGPDDLTGSRVAIALHYGASPVPIEMNTFDLVVVEPDHRTDAIVASPNGPKLFAYVSVAEVQSSRAYYPDIPAAWKLARNGDWNSDVLDQTPAAWPDFFADRVVGPLWKRGYRGFFLDTLDSYRLADKFDEQAQQDGLVRVIQTLHRKYPGIQLILNRGFELLPRVHDDVFMVAAESLYQGWNARTRQYQPVPAADRDWLMGQLRTARDQWKLPVLAIDYVAPQDRELTRATAERIKADGFIPWVADSALETVGIGSIEAVPRRVLIVYSGEEAPALNYTNAHRYLQMPLNHMGYVVEYADVLKPLPQGVLRDRYAGIATWFSGYVPANRTSELSQWLQQRMDEKMPLAVIGSFGTQPDRPWAERMGLALAPAPPSGPLQLTGSNAMMAFEIALPLVGPGFEPVQFTSAMRAQSTPLIEFQDQRDKRFVGGAITPWGGFILDPYALTLLPGSELSRWVIDPFAFLTQALRLPVMPVPDTTTENGRRLLLVHVDGDGFASRAELPGSPLAAQVLLDQILKPYKIPQTMSVIEAVVAPHGLYPQLSPQLEAIAKAMFALPYVEIGSHTYSHPFLWERSVKHGVFTEDDGAGGELPYSLKIPGYSLDLHREIVGSTEYINQFLAPKGKQVQLLQWSGDTAPGADALKIAARASLLNINGGNTSITRSNPSLTAVSALDIRKNGYLQVYAPVTNENIFTNLWRGPFYGFERAIETFQMTESPRRIKPINIYYHVYSASKRAGLTALTKVYDWALAQSPNPVYTSYFVKKVVDFEDYAVARDGTGWRVQGSGAVRTLRVPQSMGLPDLAHSTAVAGFHAGPGVHYISLGAPRAWLTLAAPMAPAPTRPYLLDANGRLSQWRASSDGLNVAFTLDAEVPLEFSVVVPANCKLAIGPRSVPPQAAPKLAVPGARYFKLQDMHARIELQCTKG